MYSMFEIFTYTNSNYFFQLSCHCILRKTEQRHSFMHCSSTTSKRFLQTRLRYQETYLMWTTCREITEKTCSNTSEYSLGRGTPATTSGPPPCILIALTVATRTTAFGSKPEQRHLMLKNFSIPMSAPKPASVTTNPSGPAKTFLMRMQRKHTYKQVVHSSNLGPRWRYTHALFKFIPGW